MIINYLGANDGQTGAIQKAASILKGLLLVKYQAIKIDFSKRTYEVNHGNRTGRTLDSMIKHLLLKNNSLSCIRDYMGALYGRKTLDLSMH